jgi:hypothetical protein
VHLLGSDCVQLHKLSAFLGPNAQIVALKTPAASAMPDGSSLGMSIA